MISPTNLFSELITGSFSILCPCKTTSACPKDVPSATVTVKGTRTSTSTGNDGSFRLAVPSNATTLVISSVGYTSTEVSISGDEVNATLEIANEALNEVVVVGYESRRMGGLTGAMSIVTRNRFSIVDSLLPAKIKVYPNPVAASETINISFPNVKPGQYQIRMLNAAGQLFYSFQKQISGKGEAEQIHLGATTAPGMYNVQVLDEKKKIVQTTKLTIQ